MGLLLQYAGENEKKVLFEYMLALDLKVKRGEYADFIRAITPLGVDLLEIVLEQSCDIDITRYYKRNNQRIWDKNRLVGEILDILNKNFIHSDMGRYILLIYWKLSRRNVQIR